MHSVVAFLLCIVVVQAIWYSEVLEAEWHSFKVDYNRSYKDDSEEQLRKQIFMNNKELIDKHNQRYAAGEESYEMDVNEYTDWSQEEFESILLNTRSELQYDSSITSEIPLSESIPRTVDWNRRGAVTPVKSQGNFGKCWAFAATGVIESRSFLKTGHLVSLSEQNLIDCCQGALSWYNAERSLFCVKAMHGIDTESSYPYKGNATQCHFDRSKVAAYVQNVIKIQPGNEIQLAWAVSQGPVAVEINSSLIRHYRRGVFNRPDCNTTIDHAVLIVGYGTERKNQDYWLVKNSWGKSWGDKGYIRMSRNRHSQCGIASNALYPIV